MERYSDVMVQIQHYFEQAKRIYRRKGLTEADAEDCAGEVRLCLLRHVWKGGTLSYAYFLRVVQGCLADFLHAQSPVLSLEDAILCGGGSHFRTQKSMCTLLWNSSSPKRVNSSCCTM